QGSGAVADQLAIAKHLDPRHDDRAEWRQGEGRDETTASAHLPGKSQQEKRRVAEDCRFHARAPCALIASIRTRFQISSTLSTNGFALKIFGSFLSNRVSTIALMRPGRADMTATRSAR